MRSPWRALVQDIELMPQHQDLGFQLLSRLEAVAQHTDEQMNRRPIAIMPRSCSDSPPTASQLDKVFGSDSHARRLANAAGREFRNKTQNRFRNEGSGRTAASNS